MKRICLFFLSCLCLFPLSAQVRMPEQIEPIKAPFEMPQLKRLTFPNRSLAINKTGARPGRLSTAAIQKAIDKMARRGGGHVIVPAGKWLSGRIILRSHVDLHLAAGAELHFSGDIKDYLPVVATRDEGIDVMSMGAMIYANGAENIALTGGGKLIAPSRDCEMSRCAEGGIKETVADVPLSERIYDGANGSKVFLPVFFGPVHCKDVMVEGVTFEKSIFWNIVPCYCENIIIRGVTVSSHGLGRTDGIDIDSSVNALIEYTMLDCGDDCFTLKSGRGRDGLRVNRPTENVVIRHCHVKRGAGGVTVGSETAGMVRNVYMHDCDMEAPSNGFYFKTRRPRGGGGENMWFERIRVSAKSAFTWDMLGSAVYVGKAAERLPKPDVTEITPVYRNIFFKDITVDRCTRLIKATGLPESPIENVVIENLKSDNHNVQLQDVGKFVITYAKKQTGGQEK